MMIRTVVLVVEDNPIILFNAVYLVESAGFEAIGAKNADEAIRILEAKPHIHLVFTDVEMPGTMDGIKLAHYIRGRWPQVHLIIVSGRTLVNESDLPASSTFFAKPYDERKLILEMKRMLSASDDAGISH